MNFNDVISFSYIMFFYVLPALIGLIVLFWIRDWVIRVVTRWTKAAMKQYELMKEDRWFVALELMKIVMFVALLFPLVAVISYVIDDSAKSPAPEIFRSTMPAVFIIITSWYILATVIYGIYWKNKEDRKREEEQRYLQGLD